MSKKTGRTASLPTEAQWEYTSLSPPSGPAMIVTHKSRGVIRLMIWIAGWLSSVAERPCEGSRGFQPTVQRTGCHCVAARRLMRRPRIGFPGFKRRSATQSHLDDAIRGLKPTATIIWSLPRPGGWSCNHEMCIMIRVRPPARNGLHLKDNFLARLRFRQKTEDRRQKTENLT